MDSRIEELSKSGHAGHPTQRDIPQLSCQLCRDRKVKCDKLDPCSNCISAGVVCVTVHRQRLPRGRHARRSGKPAAASAAGKATVMGSGSVHENELRERIDRLEAMVKNLGPRQLPAVPSTSTTASRTESSVITSSPDTSSVTSLEKNKAQAASPQQPLDFWTELVDEIKGLREVLEDDAAEVEDDTIQASHEAEDYAISHGLSFLGLGDGRSHEEYLFPGPSLDDKMLCFPSMLGSRLCDIYLRQVDPIMKVVHRGCLGSWIVEGEAYLGYPSGHATLQALHSAVCYAAVASMTERQCREELQTEKASFLLQCRRACEAAMERSGLLATKDVTVLLSFVIYLIARRIDDRSRAIWTLVAVAVRIAKGLNLHLDPVKRAGHVETFFEQQMRRRLWTTVCLLDIQACVLGITSEPLVSSDHASFTQFPAHINDEDFEPGTKTEVPSRDEFTELTMPSVTHHLQLMGHILNDPLRRADTESTSSPFGSSESPADLASWHLQPIEQFEQMATKLLSFCDPDASEMQWFAYHGTKSLIAVAGSAGLQPFFRSLQTPRVAIGGDPSHLDRILHLLETVQELHTNPRSEGFRWYMAIPWRAVAMAIAECYLCNDADVLRRAWPIVEASYQSHESVIARDSGEGLKGPLGKLMRRTREKVAALVGDDWSTGPAQTEAMLDPGVGLGSGQVQAPAEGFTTTTTTTTLGEQNIAAFADAPSAAYPLDMLDQGNIWDDFLYDLSMTDAAQSGSLFPG